MTEPAIYEHYRPAEGTLPAGIYRVVGTTEDDVKLLHVGDADGHRINTGKLHTVSDEAFDCFERAENPDGNRPLGETLAAPVVASYWGLRAFLGQLVANPVPSVVALFLIGAGVFGEGRLSVPALLIDVSSILGILLLVYAGSGRLSAHPDSG
ncbi:hypothetical protein SAMN05216226_10182 [Halovenus aranensis]|jgi:hypothetical protein|uniref:Uncharacterized protein n=1 Tax=Halovenus aranensis TaxID=890420 RepID=A0A1G8RRP1_9EURY|nr:hypothetical protein [Halovenus aranensis]SDJ19671.1 hypothetical protein SAMN05216226_10182 [Halovenus aranensis]